MTSVVGSRRSVVSTVVAFLVARIPRKFQPPKRSSGTNERMREGLRARRPEIHCLRVWVRRRTHADSQDLFARANKQTNKITVFLANPKTISK
jgi:hypothetical protein